MSRLSPFSIQACMYEYTHHCGAQIDSFRLISMDALGPRTGRRKTGLGSQHQCLSIAFGLGFEGMRVLGNQPPQKKGILYLVVRLG